MKFTDGKKQEGGNNKLLLCICCMKFAIFGLRHWLRFWVISLSIPNQQKSSPPGPQPRRREVPPDPKAEANLFMNLHHVIAWLSRCFSPPYPARAKKQERIDDGQAGAMHIYATKSDVNWLSQSEDDCLPQTHEDACGHWSLGVLIRLECCFGVIGGWKQNVAQHCQCG